ncbi:glycogen/starch/alpha-glucan phosphorylase [Candidatus Omnitrophus magneticus]|uniref:Alpha-1,4 glucan phosphorylase n=1 Tax=Candidatus Omnitrophus magneticus TaxID=1609969 RepID=A0A0F0CQ34_9BACT|nr:glycogen/starch/alpha-glucan phosphorylase [Candidatus Omnitrophus magneticus]
MDTRNIMDESQVAELKKDFMYNRKYTLAKDHYTATNYDNFQSLALSIRNRLIARWILTQQRYHDENCKRVYYLSMEFLIGRLLANNIMNMGLEKESEKAVSELGFNLEEIYEQERDAGLGNGGLGRLAACFLDSMATLGIPATGYGIRYDYGIFRQEIINGFQVERPEEWLVLGNPWEFGRPEYILKIKFYGKTIQRTDKNGKLKVDWVSNDNILAMAYDIPVAGYKNGVVNNLRLWSARSTEEFDLEYFNDGDYIKACEKKIMSENISRVLYPSDSIFKGMELRLKQEYFFTSASIQDIIRRFKMHNADLRAFPEKIAIQLNDTHPAIAIVELMRILLDEEDLEWDTAWFITVNTFAYTNHTIMPEALESWPVSLIGALLPRHLEIIYEINKRFLNEISIKYPKDHDKIKSMSLIEEGEIKKVRMSNLCIIGSHSVNGVSALHSELLKTTLFKNFYEFYPEKFNNKTNGITQRLWLKNANHGLSGLITELIGDSWITELSELKKIIPNSDNELFKSRWRDIKRQNKITLSEFIWKHKGIPIDPDSMFDVQIKRIHEYKRQLLFILFLIAQYLKIKNGVLKNAVPRTAIIGGKSAPGYYMAKLIIKFINNVAAVINNDPETSSKLRIIFLENYRVSLAEKIFPASDLSEQISTAGREASGTGNMKFMLNGALTIGTLDGANIEIMEEVGQENIFIFGLKTEEVLNLKKNGYNPKDYIAKTPILSEIIDLINDNFFSRFETDIFKPIVNNLVNHDEYMIFADFESYIKTQDIVSETYLDKNKWTKMSIMNTALAGKFSSDRTIREYAKDIWKV